MTFYRAAQNIGRMLEAESFKNRFIDSSKSELFIFTETSLEDCSFFNLQPVFI